MKVWLLHVDFFAQTQCSVREQFQGWCLDEGSRVLLGSGSPSGERRLSKHVQLVLSSKASLSMQIHSSGVDFLQLSVHLFLDLPCQFFFLNAVLLHSWKRKYGSGRGGATALCLTEVIILAAVWLFHGVVSPLAYKYGKNEFLSSPCSLFSHEQIVTGHISLKLNRPWGGRNCLHFYAKMGYLLPHLVWWQHGVQRSLPYLFNRKCHHLFLISMVTGHLESLKKKNRCFFTSLKMSANLASDGL